MSDPHAASVSLDGLEADNLLAFLALLGLLRALEAARPDWRPRVSWLGTPPRARLTIWSWAGSGNGDQSAVARAVVAEISAGMSKLAPAYSFDRDDLSYTLAEFHDLASGALHDRERAQLVAALASDVLRKGNKGDKERSVQPTLLKALGRGRQRFLPRLAHAVAQRDAGDLERALFAPWRYSDDLTESFRWDPGEDRRHAYQFGDPSEEKHKVGTEAGANRLAALGFALLTCVPTRSGLATLGVSRQRASGEVDVVWPIVSAATGLRGHVALLAHPGLYDASRCLDLAAYGVRAIARARRYQVEYTNFERARVQFL